MNERLRQMLNAEQKQIPNILTFFNLGEMRNATLLTTGIGNHNYGVATADGKGFVVKFTINRTRESLENDLAIETQLAADGIASSVYCHNANGEFIYDWESPVVVSPKIEGKHPDTISEKLCFSIGETQARLHRAIKSLPNSATGWLNPGVVRQLAEKEEDPDMQFARKCIEESRTLFEKDLPKGNIHGDFHEGNLLVNDDNPETVAAVFDFEDAGENLYIVDIARTMLAICNYDDNGSKMDRHLMQIFIDGYSSVRTLTPQEIENLPLAFKFATGAVIKWYIENDHPEYIGNAKSRIKSLSEMLDSESSPQGTSFCGSGGSE